MASNTASALGMPNIIIDWVRHAESCTNLLDKKITDKYPDTPDTPDKAQYDQFITDILAEENHNFSTEPFNRYIENAKAQLTEIIETPEAGISDDQKNQMLASCIAERTEDECWQATVGTYKDSNKAKAIFTRDKMIKSSWLYHPTLSYIGMQQALGLGRNGFFKKEILANKNIFITSPSVRTIMTGLLSLINQEENINYEASSLIIVPFINEHENVASVANLDRANQGIPPEKIDSIITTMLTWLKANKIIRDGDKVITINTEFYKTACENYQTQNPLVSNIKHFKAHILNDLFKLPGLTEKNLNILAYSHGYVISALLKQNTTSYTSRIAPNVSVFRELLSTKNMENIFNGIQVRTKFNETGENLSTNLCNLNSLRGDINKILFDSASPAASADTSADTSASANTTGGSKPHKYKSRKYKSRKNKTNKKQ